MKEASGSPKFMKTRRNFSNIQPNFQRIRNRNERSEQQREFRPKANSIKINRSKLPPDFFPRSESVRKKILSNKHELLESRSPFTENVRKASTQRHHLSPQKTSFFGFFQEAGRKEKNHANTLNLKRKFQSREQPKREKVLIQPRHFTPLNGIHRIDFLESLPMENDSLLKEVIKQKLKEGQKNKGGQISPRKEHMLKYQEAKQTMQLDPQKEEIEDVHNITFFNAKSTSFPPINKNKSSS